MDEGWNDKYYGPSNRYGRLTKYRTSKVSTTMSMFEVCSRKFRGTVGKEWDWSRGSGVNEGLGVESFNRVSETPINQVEDI